MSKKILVVEDDELEAQALAAFLEMKGYQVLQAYSSQAALQLVQTDPPDLILLNIFLQGEDGLSLLRRFKQEVDPKTGEASLISCIPVIVISDKGKKLAEVFEMEEAFALFKKPYEHQTLLMSIERALESQKS